MSEAKHTPEPWNLFNRGQETFPGIESEGGFSVVIWGDEDDDAGVRGDTHDKALANAKRIVSCVNKCAGINPEAVPEMVKALERAVSQMSSDATCIDGEFGSCRSLEEMEADGDLPEALVLARAALAKAKEGQC
jgi:hypothetical protein